MDFLRMEELEMINSTKNIENCRSLFEILNKCEIRIPIIQRDYAQGRNNDKANEVRKRLIEDMIKCLEDDKTLDFNFIYGNITDNIFYPVDGQQRLTTLYLLHWFLACRANRLDEFNELNKFSYMTRNSASEFFSLLKKPNTASEDLKKLINGSNLSKEITNYPWFMIEWINDPTVISALNFLNDLTNQDFKGCEEEYFNKLCDFSNPSIYFTVLVEESENAEASAAVKYIRMNARGKVLTTFENVKAMLDGIDKRLSCPIEIIRDYDISFIDIFYNMSKSINDLETKSKEIDAKSMNLFRNIYNVCATIKDEETFKNDLEYSNYMYYLSQSDKHNDFIEFYLMMVEAILRAIKNNNGIFNHVSRIFESNFCTSEKYVVAHLLYVYHLYNHHWKVMCGINDDNTEENKENIKKNFIVIGEMIEKFIYILNNLNYEYWEQEAYKQINCLIKSVVKFDDIFKYFSNTLPSDILIGETATTLKVLDIRMRIKEQHIKSKIISVKNLNYDEFKSLEVQSTCMKIQYLLLISGLWEDNLSSEKFNENINFLWKYRKLAEKYFKISIVDLEWRKLYAIASSWDSSENKLLPAVFINKNVNKWKDNYYWEDSTYFWNDNADDSPHKKLEKLKETYDLILSHVTTDELFHYVKENLSSDLYSNCWLTYAISRNYDELLKNEISYKNRKLTIIYQQITHWNNFTPVNFMLYVLLRDNGICNIGDNHSNHSGDFGNRTFKNVKQKTICFEGNKRYISENGALQHLDWRNYNLTLLGEAGIIFENEPKDDIAYIYDVGSTNLRYKVYENITDSNCFKVYYLDMTSSLQEIQRELSLMESEQNQIENDFYSGKYDEILKIQHYTHCGNWKHEGHNSRTWKWYVEIKRNLSIEQEHKLLNFNIEKDKPVILV